jgi:hypothetical protein
MVAKRAVRVQRGLAYLVAGGALIQIGCDGGAYGPGGEAGEAAASARSTPLVVKAQSAAEIDRTSAKVDANGTVRSRNVPELTPHATDSRCYDLGYVPGDTTIYFGGHGYNRENCR